MPAPQWPPVTAGAVAAHWLWEDGGNGFKPFSTAASGAIEGCFQARLGQCNVPGTPHRVLFSVMQRQNVYTQQICRVKRMPGPPPQHVPNLVTPPIGPLGISWEWQNDAGGFTPYLPHVATAIEQAYALKQGKFDIPQSHFRIVFSQMFQVCRVRIVHFLLVVKPIRKGHATAAAFHMFC